MRKRKVKNWGNYPATEGTILTNYPGAGEQAWRQPKAWIARGLGRCYGDASLGECMVSGLAMNRLLEFDPDTGLLRAESGVTYADLLTVFIPKGWFPPVTPGTRFVTLGGAVASDVHGKNHHAEGSLYRHVERLLIRTGAGEWLDCSREEHEDLFDATFGGMGLTGWIAAVTLRLKPISSPWIAQRAIRCADLAHQMEVFEQEQETPYSVSWLDCLHGKGKGVFLGGRHADADTVSGRTPIPAPGPPRISLPFSFPEFTLNRLTVGAFNYAYFARSPRTPATQRVPYLPFFYPLDALGHWNRMYGRRGFVQYQFVVPLADARRTLPPLLAAIRNAPSPPFLAVLKRFGPASGGWMSFPMEGYTLAVDFPVRNGLFNALDQLDARVAEAGGRVYLAKDARMNGKWLATMYPRLDDFRQLLARYDPQGAISSLQSERLGLRFPLNDR